MIEYSKILSVIDRYEVISFDIYNTLLYRHVANDEDIFRVVQDCFHRTFGKEKTHFHQVRLEAETEALTAMGSESVSFDEIYRHFHDEDAEKLKSIEWKLEQTLTTVREEGRKLYQYCVDKHKHIIAISDMYYDGAYLKKLLLLHGYHIDDVFSSSDFGVTKHSGKLYRKVCKRLGTEPKRILHIGDTLRSDFLMARKEGLHSILLAKKELDDRFELPNRAEQVYLNAMYQFASNISQGSSFYNELGVCRFGPLLFGFCTWLHHKVKQLQINQIYFLSRDAYLVKQAYELLYPDAGEDLRYIYISRKAVRVPLLMHHHSFDVLKDWINHSNYISFRILISRLGLQCSDVEGALDLDLDQEYAWDDFFSDKTVEENYKRIESQVVENAKAEMHLIERYLIQEQFGGDAALVDIGWDGTIQKSLNLLFKENNIDCRLFGFYFGANQKVSHDCMGYLYDYHDDRHCDNREVLVSSYGLFESLFLANHGSVKCYAEEIGAIVPVLEPYEFLTKDGKELQELGMIKEIQKGALTFIREYCKCKCIRRAYLRSEYYFKPIKRLLVKPTKTEIQKLKRIPFHDTFNIDLIEDPQSPAQLLHGFKRSVWKIGYLKNSIRINLPYYEIYRLMKKMLK